MILSQLDTIALLAIFLIGIPHGALDIDLTLAVSESKKNRSLYYLGYVGLAVASFCLWVALPTASLLIFLIVSTLHFGRSNPFGLTMQRPAKTWELACLQLFMGGAATIFIPALYWSQVSELFSYLGAEPAVLSAVGVVMLPIWLMSAGLSALFLQDWRVTAIFLSLCAVTLAKAFFSPLILFGFYFCVLHSTFHFTRAMKFLRLPILTPPPMFLVNTVIAWISVFAAYEYFGPSSSSAVASLNAVFGVLFALTMPHMFLVDALLPGVAHYWRADYLENHESKGVHEN